MEFDGGVVKYTAKVPIDEAAGGGEFDVVLAVQGDGKVLLEMSYRDGTSANHVIQGQPVIYAYMGTDIEAAKPKAKAIVEAVVAGWNLV